METPVPNFYFMGVQFLHLLALAVWVGGILILQCIVAPILIRFLSSRQSADLVLHEIFKKFHQVTLFCAGVLLSTSVIKFFSWETLTPWNAIRYSAIFAMILVSLYVNYGFSLISRRALASTSKLENKVPLTATHLKQVPVSSEGLMMISLVCGLTATLMA